MQKFLHGIVQSSKNTEFVNWHSNNPQFIDYRIGIIWVLYSFVYATLNHTASSLKKWKKREVLRQNSQAHNSLIPKFKVKRQSHKPLLKKSTDYNNNKRHTSFTLQANLQSDTYLSLINHSLKRIQTNLNLTIYSFISLDTSQPHAAYFLNSTHIGVVTRSADKIHVTVFISKTPRIIHIRLVRSTGRLPWWHWPQCWNPDPQR